MHCNIGRPRLAFQIQFVHVTLNIESFMRSQKTIKSSVHSAKHEKDVCASCQAWEGLQHVSFPPLQPKDEAEANLKLRGCSCSPRIHSGLFAVCALRVEKLVWKVTPFLQILHSFLGAC